MTIRNEDPARAFTRFETVKRSVDLTGCGAAFDYFVLSDTTDAAVAAQEEALFADWQAREAGAPSILVYRRRENNEGFKAGNVRDFCRRWGAHYEFMLPLDADDPPPTPPWLRRPNPQGPTARPVHCTPGAGRAPGRQRA
jgi:membrane glycosyltransferase